MNEVEKHYSTQGSGGAGAGSSGSSGQGGHSASQHGSSGAKGGLSGAAETARSATESARQTAGDALEKASNWGREQYGSASRTVSEASRRSAQEFSRRRRGIEGFVEENPVMVGVVGVAAGLLVGALLPSTRRENQVFGRYADEVRDQGLRYARELAEQGKHFVEENLDAVAKAAPPQGRPAAPQSGGGMQSGSGSQGSVGTPSGSGTQAGSSSMPSGGTRSI